VAKKTKPRCRSYKLMLFNYTTDDDGIHLNCRCGWESIGIHRLDIKSATRIARAHCKGDTEKVDKIVRDLRSW
jgi:hypothetical protein